MALEQFARHRSDDELLALIAEHPSWAPLCWRPLAEAYAAKGEHTRAFQLISSACPAPDLSILQTNLSIDALRAEHLRAPKSLKPTIRLAHQHMRRGNRKRALDMLRKITTADEELLAIVQYMIAYCLAQESQHQQASKALLSYVEMLE